MGDLHLKQRFKSYKREIAISTLASSWQIYFIILDHEGLVLLSNDFSWDTIPLLTTRQQNCPELIVNCLDSDIICSLHPPTASKRWAYLPSFSNRVTDRQNAEINAQISLKIMQYVNIFSARHVCIICLHFKFKVEAKPGNINILNCIWDLCGLKRPLWASGDIFCMWNLSSADMLPCLGFLGRFCQCNQHYFVYTLMMVVTASSNIV